MPSGPRIYFKRDEESGVGRGAHIYGAHFCPEIAHIVWAVARSCSHVIAELWVTEGYRDIRDERDMHEECRAFDFTFRTSSGNRPGEVFYDDIAEDASRLLGPDYDVVVHGTGANLHIHIEYDPR